MIVDDLDWYFSDYSLVELGVSLSLSLFLPSNSFIFFLPVFSALQVTLFGWTAFIEIYVWLDYNSDVDQEDP